MMQAFHNNTAIKEKYLNRVISHRKADEIVQGTYWYQGEGCAVGCTIHARDHEKYETQLGIPEWVAELEDQMFEGMSNKDAKEFPEKFLNAIPVGFTNWDEVWHELCIYLLEEICKDHNHASVKEEIDTILILHKTREGDTHLWRTASEEAWSRIWLLEMNDVLIASRSVHAASYMTSVWSIPNAVYQSVESCALAKHSKIEKSDLWLQIAEKTLEILENQK